jgi:hypothetical protein
MPATYPMAAAALPSSVFVNNPAQESRFAVYFSISAHEIGHSVWRHHQIANQVVSKLGQDLDAAIAALAPAPPAGEAGRLRNACLGPALRQLEEIFCDVYALATFGDAYPYAYDYYLGPGSPPSGFGIPVNISAQWVYDQRRKAVENSVGLFNFL